MDMHSKLHREQFPPPKNMPPGATYKSRGIFFLRQVLDLQVASVVRDLQPWLAGIRGHVLEIGCGAQPYRFMIPQSCTYQGLDWQGAEQFFQYRESDTVYYDGKTFPFNDNCFDHLFHTEVLEHIYEKELFLRECFRVLKPSGALFFSVPFQARYHYIPYDFWRFTPAALEKLLTDNGFEHIKILPRGNDITVAAYKVISIIYRWLQDGIVDTILGVLCLPVAMVFLLLGHLAMRMHLGSSDDCLGYSVTASVHKPL